MAVRKHFKFTFRGIFNETPEEWSFGFKMGRVVDQGSDGHISDIDTGAVTSALAAFLTSANVAGNVWATDWRAYEIGTNGKMENNPLVVDVSTDTGVRGNTTNRYPLQIAAAVTLVSNNRGPARYGRFYIPGPSSTIAQDMRWTDAQCSTMAESATQLLKGVSDAIDFPLNPNGSAGINVSGGGGPDGTWQEIDHVEVGRVPDTMQSRRRSMLEERHVHGHIDW